MLLGFRVCLSYSPVRIFLLPRQWWKTCSQLKLKVIKSQLNSEEFIFQTIKYLCIPVDILKRIKEAFILVFPLVKAYVYKTHIWIIFNLIASFSTFKMMAHLREMSMTTKNAVF